MTEATDRRSQTHRAILLAAAELFEVKGYHDTSVGDICRTSGTSRANFYLHFATRGELVGEMLDALEPTVRPRVLALDVAPTTFTGMRAWLDGYHALWMENRGAFRAFHQALGTERLVASKWLGFLDDVSRSMPTILAAHAHDDEARGRRALEIRNMLMCTEQVFYFDLISGTPVATETNLAVLATQWLRLRRA